MGVNEVKILGGWSSVILVLFISVLATILAIDSNKNLAFQVVAQKCILEKSESCNELIKFGVSPELYLKNKDYQKKINNRAIDAIESNSVVAGQLANFTLDYVGNKQVKLAVKVIEELEKLSESSK